MSKRVVLTLAALAAHATSRPVEAAPAWQVIAGENGSVLTAGMPVGTSRTFADYAVADAGLARFALRISVPSSLAGYWRWRNGQWSRYAQIDAAGATGPGRTGSEANDIFLSLNTGWGETAPDGQQLIAGRASDPNSSFAASYGLWRATSVGNIEIVRGGADGVLGPGLGAGWTFPNSSGFVYALGLADGQSLMNAEVRSPSNASSRILALHQPGIGNLPCTRSGATEAAFAPGLQAGDSFASFSTDISRFAVTREGEVIARLVTSTAREAIWRLCEGSPQALAVDNEVGVRGPGTEDAAAEFVSFFSDAPVPMEQGVVYFANWRVPPQLSERGLFHFNGSGNEGVAYNDISGFHGPNWMNASWRVFDATTLTTGGRWLAFSAGLTTGDGGNPSGLWRVRLGDRPELVALLGLSQAPYAPEAGRTWRSFGGMVVFGNGDIVLDATTDPGATEDLWLLRRGFAPKRLLSTGQVLQVATAQGVVATSVSTMAIPSQGAKPSAGADSWVATDGTLLVSVNTPQLGRLLLSTRLRVPGRNIAFSEGFEDD